MTYEQQRNNYYGLEVYATPLDIALGVTFLKTVLRLQYHEVLEIHICGKKAYITI